MQAQGARFFNRELSWLKFNRRVLEEAQDETAPLIERAKFLAIVSSNLDEFCMVRLAMLIDTRWELERDAAGLLPSEQLEAVRAEVRRLIDDEYVCWNGSVAPGLAAHGFEIVPASAWTQEDRVALRTFYRDQLEPALTPLAVDPTRPFPLIANRGITIGILLRPSTAAPINGHSGEISRALVAVPAGRRMLALPGAPGRVALVEEVVEQFVDSLFPGYSICGRGQFRLTRDGSIDIDEDQATDLLSELEQELRNRGHGRPVRVEIAADAPEALRSWLIEALDLEAIDFVPIAGPLDLTFLFSLASVMRMPELMDAPYHAPALPFDFSDPFAVLREREVFLHHPYESFQPVVDLVERAAEDQNVLAIKQTLYRVSGDSPIVKALMRAAEAGKQVTVLVELKARFEEAANIRWAKQLEESGAHVIYGLVGLKVHSKLLLIVRRDEDGIRRYCHIGTGNYNDRTAKLYTDFSYMTANEAVGRDMAALFNMLTGFAQPPAWERLEVAPLTMRTRFIEWIRREAARARMGRGGRIMAKFNSLVDVGIAEELYAASQAGVEIDLVIRGICILRPGVPGLSERIRVRSVVGRFLEHSRFYYFQNGSTPVIATASADWMTRNLDRRVEALVRIENPEICEWLVRLFEIILEDNAQARELQPDGTYVRLKPGEGEPERRTQRRHMEEALKRAEEPDEEEAPKRVFVPFKRMEG